MPQGYQHTNKVKNTFNFQFGTLKFQASIWLERQHLETSLHGITTKT